MDLYDALQPLHYLSKSVGLASHSLSTSGQRRYVFLKRDLILNKVVVAVVLILNFVTGYYNVPKITSKVLGVVKAFVIVAIIFNSGVTLVLARLNGRHFVSCIETLVNLDYQVNNITQSNTCYKTIKTNLVYQIVSCYTVIIIMAVLDLQVVIHSENSFRQFLLTLFYFITIILTVDVFLWLRFLVKQIHGKLCIINSFITDCICETDKASFRKLKRICKIHGQIWDLSKEVNVLYESYILRQIFICFAFSIDLISFATTCDLFEEGYYTYNYICTAVWVCWQLMEISLCLHYFTGLGNQVRYIY